MAAPMHMSWLSPWEAGRVALAIARILRDSEATDEVVVAEEITAQRQLRFWIETGIFESGDGASLLCDRPEIAETDVDFLRGLPKGSLGRSFAEFLDNEGISLSGLAQPTPFTQDALASYLMRRIRQSHDIWHVLLGLGTQGHEEVLLHCFSIAQTGFPNSTMIIGLGALKHFVLEGRWQGLSSDIYRAWRSGCDAAPLLTVRWEDRWEQPLTAVRQDLHLTPLNAPLA